MRASVNKVNRLYTNCGRMDKVFDASWGLSNAELLQQMGLLSWLSGKETTSDAYQAITAGRVAYELYNRVTGKAEIDKYKAECLQGIVNFIRDNPGATKTAIDQAVLLHVQIFAARVDAM
ncbi:uncharacterized protein LOC142929723 isoform X1 [Petromyzon marinus]|uniref:uncharacterized protein LOC142929723 isoform X1 n=2 Tax=Petromyzon marinus TaxID=7757 RepID=UPI003F70304B